MMLAIIILLTTPTLMVLTVPDVAAQDPPPPSPKDYSPDNQEAYQSFMLGRVAVIPIFPYSNSGKAWSNKEIKKVHGEIDKALDWWEKRFQEEFPNSDATLNFDRLDAVNVGIKSPTKNPTSTAHLIDDTLGNIEPKLTGGWNEKIPQYIDTQRKGSYDWIIPLIILDPEEHLPEYTYKDVGLGVIDGAVVTDLTGTWAATIIMRYDRIDDHKYFSRFWPWTWGRVNSFRAAIAHEIAHVFGAAEGYSATPSGQKVGMDFDKWTGYLGVKTPANFLVNLQPKDEDEAKGKANGLMGGADYTYEGYRHNVISQYTKEQIGWRDTDKDGLPDPLDTYPHIEIFEITDTHVRGEVYDAPYPKAERSNSKMAPVTINTLTQIQMYWGNTTQGNTAVNLEACTPDLSGGNLAQLEVASVVFTCPLRTQEGQDQILTVEAYNNQHNRTSRSFLAEDLTPLSQTLSEKRDAAIHKGLAYLRRSQKSNGSWSDNVGITALSTLALLNAGAHESDPTVSKGIEFLLAHWHPAEEADYGHFGEGKYATYYTTLSILALDATQNPFYQAPYIVPARSWLVRSQWDEDCSWGEVHLDDWRYGGFGYGGEGTKRPDLSNTQWALLALHVAGLPPNDPTWRKALTFVERCQDDDGGFHYLPHNKDYKGGSMTAAGLWGLTLCGQTRGDTALEAGIDWLARECKYSLDENPGGRGQAALYYYYASLAKALSMSRKESIGELDDWYAQLSQVLIARQREDGSWVNKNHDHRENNPSLVTTYALMALQTRRLPKNANLKMAFILHSPGRLHVYDGDGRHVGKTSWLGAEAEIPGAERRGLLEQRVELEQVEAGNYYVEIIGTRRGAYALEILGYQDGNVVSRDVYTQTIQRKEVQGSFLNVGAFSGQMNIFSTPPDHTAAWTTSPGITQIISRGGQRETTFAIREISDQQAIQEIDYRLDDLHGFMDEEHVVSGAACTAATPRQLPAGAKQELTLLCELPSRQPFDLYEGALILESRNAGARRVPVRLIVAPIWPLVCGSGLLILLSSVVGVVLWRRWQQRDAGTVAPIEAPTSVSTRPASPGPAPPQPARPTCPSCGYAQRTAFKFCPRCGHALTAASPTPPSSPPEPTLKPQADVDARLKRGIAQVKAGETMTGYRVLLQVVKDAPDNAEAWLWVGWAAVKKGERRTAERCFLRAQRLGHPHAERALRWLKSS
jgi:squalene-hopene/tetraprenyl-beta-curcumene cyclase